MSNIVEQMLEESKRQLELEFEHKKELAQIKSCQNNEIKELKEKYKNKIADLEAKLAESEKNLNQYPYKNDVIEKQYEDLKDGIKFRIENNITDDWEQLYHCIDVLCEKHKARIRDIENSICSIEQLKQQLAEKDEEIKQLNNRILISQLQAPKEQILNILGSQCIQYNPDQDKISFAVEKLEQAKVKIQQNILFVDCDNYVNVIEEINNQIKELKEGK